MASAQRIPISLRLPQPLAARLSKLSRAVSGRRHELLVRAIAAGLPVVEREVRDAVVDLQSLGTGGSAQ